MEFREGMLGVVIVALALTGAFFVSYLSGIETTEQEVTKYDYLADVSGLFDYDKSPQYIEFDPSTNYTGYYSTDSKKELGDGYYFAEREVGYMASVDSKGNPRVNNYRLDLPPEQYTTGTQDLSGLDRTFHVEDYNAPISIYYNYNLSDGTNVTKTAYSSTSSLLYNEWNMKVVYLSDILNEIGIKQSGEYTIIPHGPVSDGSSSTGDIFDSNWILFTNEAKWERNTTTADTVIGWYQEQYKCASNSYNAKNGTSFTIPEISCRAVVTAITDSNNVTTYSGTVTLYADTGLNYAVETIDVSHCVVCFGVDTPITTSGMMLLATSCDYTYSVPRTAYLDPAYGVSLDGTDATYTITVAVSDPDAGTVNGEIAVIVSDLSYGDTITVSGNTITIKNTTITATAETGYVFSQFNTISGEVRTNKTIIAYFVEDDA